MQVDGVKGQAVEKLLKTAEVADLLRVTRRTVDVWRARGAGPRAIKVGGAYRYREADVEQWIDEQNKTNGGR